MWKRHVALKVFGSRGMKERYAPIGSKRITEIEFREKEFLPCQFPVKQILNLGANQWNISGELSFHNKVGKNAPLEGMFLKPQKFKRPKSSKIGLYHKLQPRRKMSIEKQKKGILQLEPPESNFVKYVPRDSRECGGTVSEKATASNHILDIRVSPTASFILKTKPKEREDKKGISTIKKNQEGKKPNQKAKINLLSNTKIGINMSTGSPQSNTPRKSKLSLWKFHKLRTLEKSVQEAPLKRALSVAAQRKVDKLVEDKKMFNYTKPSKKEKKVHLVKPKPNFAWVEPPETQERRKRDMLKVLQNGRKERELLRKINSFDTRSSLERIPMMKDGNAKEFYTYYDNLSVKPESVKSVGAARPSLLERMQASREKINIVKPPKKVGNNPMARLTEKSRKDTKKETNMGSFHDFQMKLRDNHIAKNKLKKSGIQYRSLSSSAKRYNRNRRFVSTRSCSQLKKTSYFDEPKSKVKPMGLFQSLQAKNKCSEQSLTISANSKGHKDLFWSLQAKLRNEKKMKDILSAPENRILDAIEKRSPGGSNSKELSLEDEEIDFGKKSNTNSQTTLEEFESTSKKKHPFPWIELTDVQVSSRRPESRPEKPRVKWAREVEEPPRKVSPLERIPPVPSMEEFPKKRKKLCKERPNSSPVRYLRERAEVRLALELEKQLPSERWTNLLSLNESEGLKDELMLADDREGLSYMEKKRIRPGSMEKLELKAAESEPSLALGERYRELRRSLSTGSRDDWGCKGVDELLEDAEDTGTESEGLGEARPAVVSLFERLQKKGEKKALGGGSQWPEELFDKSGCYSLFHAYAPSPPPGPSHRTPRHPNHPRYSKEPCPDVIEPPSPTSQHQKAFTFKSPGFMF